MKITEHGTLEAEREFLLRSLDDLESERDAGNIDDDTYRTLHDDYTARAAEVIRAIEHDTEPALPQAPPAPRWMRVVTITAIVVFACAAGYVLTRAVGSRAPGQTATGNSQVAEDPLVRLQEAVEAAPDDYDARIEYARALINQDRVAALREYDAAAQIDPTQPEPVTYAGWITGLAAGAATAEADRALLVDRALERFNTAIALDPQYPDAYVFRGIVQYDVLGDAAASVRDFEMFLALAPSDHPMRTTVESTLSRAIEESGLGEDQ